MTSAEMLTNTVDTTTLEVEFKRPEDHVVLALDFEQDIAHMTGMLSLARERGIFAVKIGKAIRLNSAYWSHVIRIANRHATQIYVDGNYEDSPDQLALTIQTEQAKNINFMSVSMNNSLKALQKAAQTATRSVLVARTIPYDMTEQECVIDFDIDTRNVKHSPVKDRVLSMSQKAARAGLQAVTASAHEMQLLRHDPEASHLLRIADGIRLNSDGVHTVDSPRYSTPEQAILYGAQLLIAGRAITQAQGKTVDQALDIFLERIASVTTVTAK